MSDPISHVFAASGADNPYQPPQPQRDDRFGEGAAFGGWVGFLLFTPLLFSAARFLDVRQDNLFSFMPEEGSAGALLLLIAGPLSVAGSAFIGGVVRTMFPDEQGASMKNMNDEPLRAKQLCNPR